MDLISEYMGDAPEFDELAIVVGLDVMDAISTLSESPHQVTRLSAG